MSNLYPLIPDASTYLVMAPLTRSSSISCTCSHPGNTLRHTLITQSYKAFFSLSFLYCTRTHKYQYAVLSLTSQKVNPYNRSITSWHEGTPSMSTLKSILASLSVVGGTISAGLLALRTEGAMTPGIRRFCCAPMVVKKYKKSRVKRECGRERERERVNQAVF